MANRLTTGIRSGDTVLRSGGDEFIIVLPEITHPADAILGAKKIIEIFSAPLRIDGQLLEITTSIGIAVYAINGTDDAQKLMKKADKAMYAAKKAGRNGFQLLVENAGVEIRSQPPIGGIREAGLDDMDLVAVCA